jgi:hypothetical protein
VQNDQKEIKDLVDRYIYQVVKHLPQEQRADIEKELRGLIEDTLTARSENPAMADAEAVLKELGTPIELAAKYRGSSRYLIGPEYYDMYLFVLKIVLAAVTFGMALAQIIGNITSPPENIWAAIGLFFGSIFSAVVQAFAWVTAVFALMEHFVREKLWKKEEWKPSDLPPVPVQQAAIKKSEPIVGIIFSILWLILITTAPQLIGAYIAPAGEVIDAVGVLHAIIPVFNLTVLAQLMPLVVIIICLGIVKEVLRLAEGRYTVRLAIAMTVLNAASLILFIWVYGGPAIWNPNFITSLNVGWSAGGTAAYVWSIIPKILVGLAVFGNIVDSITAFARALRHKETHI